MEDYGGTFGGGHEVTKNFFESIRLTHEHPTGSISKETCAGDEARGELLVNFDLRGEEIVTVVRLRLYEGTNCFSRDLDAEDYRFLRIDESESREVHAYGRNYEPESYDRVWADFSVSQNTGPPPEPSHVLANRISIGRVEITWVDEARLETGYEIRFNSIGGAIKSLPPNTTKYIFSIPGPTGPKQCIQVRAVGAQGPSEWTPVGPFVECG
ncbi:hypothetical protein [Streptomyces sp. R33]|uniref:Fibronectin type-III domain-containing protein n=1 Tax=Streptomyces sp. R33 TaxID=3238629 RepID=A0AB39YHY9_9ACTN